MKAPENAWGVVVHVDGDDGVQVERRALSVLAPTGIEAGRIAEELTGGSLFFFCLADDLLRDA